MKLESKFLIRGYLGGISEINDVIILLSPKGSCSYHNTKCIEAISKSWNVLSVLALWNSGHTVIVFGKFKKKIKLHTSKIQLKIRQRSKHSNSWGGMGTFQQRRPYQIKIENHQVTWLGFAMYCVGKRSPQGLEGFAPVTFLASTF